MEQHELLPDITKLVQEPTMINCCIVVHTTTEGVSYLMLRYVCEYPVTCAVQFGLTVLGGDVVGS